MSPTLTSVGTVAGVIVGTASYMSPEQARGKPVDKRTDIWAFGCVLYEMLTGRHAFRGETAIDIATAVLSSDPEWSSLPTTTPPALHRLLLWCLRKEAKQRLQHLGDARILLSEISDGGPLGKDRSDSTVATRAPSWGLALPVALALILLGAALSWLAGRSGPAPTGRATPYDWDPRPLTATGDAWSVSMHPDGETVAYLNSNGLVTQDASGGDPNLVLADSDWMKRPDASPVGFVPRSGKPLGEPQWLRDGTAVAFTVPIDSTTIGISAVPRMGGAVRPLLTVTFDGGELGWMFQSLEADAFLLARPIENRRAAPWIRWVEEGVVEGVDVPADIVDLWDAVGSAQGDWVAYIGERDDGTTVLATISRDGSTHNVIAERRSELSKWHELSMSPQWPFNRIMRWPPGSRVYYRENSTRGLDLYAVTLDPESGRAVGEPELIYSGLPPGATFDVASGGERIVYSGGVIKTQIRVFRFDRDRGGEPVEDWQMTRGTARHLAPRVSRDGTRVAYIRKTRGSDDIYIAPLREGEPEPVQVLYSWDHVVDLKWSPTGDELVVYAKTPHGPQLVRVSLSDSRVIEIDTPPPRGTWFDLSPDGERLAYGIQSDESYVVHELTTGEKREFFTDLPGEKIQGLFSPDGQELLTKYLGQLHAGLWAQRLDANEPRLVTEALFAAIYPVGWAADGTIYALAPDGTIFALDPAEGSHREFGRIPERPIGEGWASLHATAEDLYLVCAVGEPRESDVWIMDRVEEPADH